MKRIVLVLSLLGLLLLGRTFSFAFATDTYQIRGAYTEAYAYFPDPSGCVWTYIGLLAQDGKIRDNSGKNAMASSTVYFNRYDRCRQASLLDTSGTVTLGDRDFSVQGSLGSATLITTVPVVDSLTQQTFNLALNLIWTATNDPERYHSHESDTYGNFKITYRSGGILRSATPSGSITLAGENLISGQTLTGDIGRTTNSEITVSH